MYGCVYPIGMYDIYECMCMHISVYVFMHTCEVCTLGISSDLPPKVVLYNANWYHDTLQR